MNLQLARWIQHHLSDDFWGDGGGGPPGRSPKLVFGEPDDDGLPMNIATTYNNDGMELWLGYRTAGWQAHYGARAARRLAWFILWDWWIVSTWCGLRRWIWYKALHTIVESYERITPDQADAAQVLT